MNFKTVKEETFFKAGATLIAIITLHVFGQMFVWFSNDFTTKNKIFLVIFNISSFLIYIYFYFTITNNGFLPEMLTDREYLFNRNILIKYCARCKLYRPERSHHCSRCKRCVKKMDHHCFWVGTCINNDNLGHFARFLFFASVSTLYLFFFLCYLIFQKIKLQYEREYAFQIILMTSFAIFSLFVGVITTLFFKTTLKNIITNTTYIEQENYERYYDNKISDLPNPYDLGIWKNLKETFGSPFLLFLVGKGNKGIIFNKTYNSNTWPPRWNSKDVIIEIEDDRAIRFE